MTLSVKTLVQRYCYVFVQAHGPATYNPALEYPIQPVIKKLMFDGEWFLNFMCLCCDFQTESYAELIEHLQTEHGSHTITELDLLKQKQHEKMMSDD